MTSSERTNPINNSHNNYSNEEPKNPTDSKTISFLKYFGLGAMTAWLGWEAINYFSRYDYSNQETLRDLRRQARNQPLQKTIDEHTWENVFHYVLPTEEDFNPLYRAHVGTSRSFNEILSFYHKAHDELNGMVRKHYASYQPHFNIPSPTEWKAMFDAEVRGMRCDKILENYPLQDLKTFKLVSSKQEHLLDKTVAAKKLFNSRKNEIDHLFQSELAPDKNTFARKKRAADSTYDNHRAHDDLQRIQQDKTNEIIGINSRRARELAQAARDLFGERLYNTRQDIHNAADQEIREVHNLARLRKTDFERVLNRARELRDATIGKARGELLEAEDRIRLKFDPEYRENTATYEQEINELNRKYHA